MAESKGYGQFCPVALAAEVLAERWTPLIIRELLMGSTRFNDLQRGLPRMSPSLLAQRLRQLQFAGVLDRRRGEGGGLEYHLTPSGRELFPIIEGMGLWAQRWLRHELADVPNLDPDLLMWDIRRNVLKHVKFERQRYVAAFQLVGAPINRRRYWLVFERGYVDLCYKDPGFDVDLFVEADLRTLTEIWLGHVTIDDAVRKDLLRFEGARRNVAAFRSWFALSMFAPAGRFPTGQQELMAK
jgi:DNA-binding HxlR family transcriptional regulator